MALEVLFHPLAAEDLEAIYDYIARDSPKRAQSFVSRIRQRCESLAMFPDRGRPKPEIAEGIRLLSFERRLVIAYRKDNENLTIWRVVSAGRDLDVVLRDSDQTDS